jgi:hypothetical protein
VKFLCFGYYDKSKVEGMSESERNAMFDTIYEYNDHLRASGNSLTGEAIQGPEKAVTLYGRTARW